MRRAPGLQLWADRTRAGPTRHQAELLLQAQAQRPLALGLALRDNAAHPWQPQRQTCLYGDRRLCTIAGIALTAPAPEGEPTVAPDAQAQHHLLQCRGPIFVRALGRTGGNRGRLRVGLLGGRRCEVFRGPRQGKCRRLLMEPQGREGLHLERFERAGPEHLVQVRRTQRIEQLPETVILQGLARAPRLQERQPATLFQPLPDLLPRRGPSPDGQHERFSPPTARHHVIRRGRQQRVEHCRPLQFAQPA